jgi:hypothetical protein
MSPSSRPVAQFPGRAGVGPGERKTFFLGFFTQAAISKTKNIFVQSFLLLKNTLLAYSTGRNHFSEHNTELFSILHPKQYVSPISLYMTESSVYSRCV